MQLLNGVHAYYTSWGGSTVHPQSCGAGCVCVCVQVRTQADGRIWKVWASHSLGGSREREQTTHFLICRFHRFPRFLVSPLSLLFSPFSSFSPRTNSHLHHSTPRSKRRLVMSLSILSSSLKGSVLKAVRVSAATSAARPVSVWTSRLYSTESNNTNGKENKDNTDNKDGQETAASASQDTAGSGSASTDASTSAENPKSPQEEALAAKDKQIAEIKVNNRKRVFVSPSLSPLHSSSRTF